MGQELGGGVPWGRAGVQGAVSVELRGGRCFERRGPAERWEVPGVGFIPLRDLIPRASLCPKSDY